MTGPPTEVRLRDVTLRDGLQTEDPIALRGWRDAMRPPTTADPITMPAAGTVVMVRSRPSANSSTERARWTSMSCSSSSRPTSSAAAAPNASSGAGSGVTRWSRACGAARAVWSASS